MTTTANASPHSMQVVPGGVADVETGILYLHGTAGRVDAVDLSTGVTRWSDGTPARPLAVDGGHLLVEIVSNGGVRLAVRPARARQHIGTSTSVALPPWAVGGRAAGVIFSSLVGPSSQRGVVRYHWNVERRVTGGMHRPRGGNADEDAVTSQQAAGDVLVETATAKQVRVTVAADRSLPFATEYGRSQSAWDVDGASCAFAAEPREGASWLIVRCTRDGDPAPLTIPIAAAPLSPRLSTDGRLVAIDHGGGPWRTIRLPSGEEGPQLPATIGSAPFAVVGDELLTVHSPRETAAGKVGMREIHAWSLDGTMKWRHALYTPPWLPPQP